MEARGPKRGRSPTCARANLDPFAIIQACVIGLVHPGGSDPKTKEASIKTTKRHIASVAVEHVCKNQHRQFLMYREDRAASNHEHTLDRIVAQAFAQHALTN